MKSFSPLVLLLTLLAAGQALGSQADDTTIQITSRNPGPTPFIEQLVLQASDTSVLKSIQFTVSPKPGSVTRPLSGNYANDYLIDRGLEDSSGQIFLSVYGLYANYSNTVTLTYQFLDGSSKSITITVATGSFDDQCGYKTPTILQARTDDTSLSYDYMLVKNSCGDFSPIIIDTDGAVRWVGTAGFGSFHSTLYDNAVYFAATSNLFRIELDGTQTLLHDYSDIGVLYFHHTIDRGKFGLILDGTTADYIDSLNIEVDAAGDVLKQWNWAQIISDAMIAGGDDPSQFVAPSPDDWFHNNSTIYDRATDSIIASSRENFVIALDYETGAIKWILGDPTKKWYTFPSLQKYALGLTSDSAPPVGQHAPSYAFNHNLMVYDNGEMSLFQKPAGIQRTYSIPRRYSLDLEAGTATETFDPTMDDSVFTSFCGSVYEDAPANYLVDYAFINNIDPDTAYARLRGINSGGDTVFYYQYPTVSCATAFNSIPLHLESTKFPTVEPQNLNVSTRGQISNGDDTLIAGFIVSGSTPQKVALRLLGPSLDSSNLTGAANPALTLFDATGQVVATNDNWQTDPGSAELSADGLAPNNALEAATIQTLDPGSYTIVASASSGTLGLGLIEVYALSPSATSKLGNISTRGFVGDGDDVLIGGFIIGDVASEPAVVRALGPSLAGSGVTNPIANPALTIYDSNGVALVSNSAWADDSHSSELAATGLAPSDPSEAAVLLQIPAGAYTAIVSGEDGATGVGLFEVFDLATD